MIKEYIILTYIFIYFLNNTNGETSCHKLKNKRTYYYINDM